MNEEVLRQKTEDIERGFIPYLPKEEGYAKTVLEAMNYSILAGGKRLRPMFLYEAFHVFGGREEAAVRPFMMAIEMIHTYSLVHDDLPAMDNDDYRRGKLTTHKKYGEDIGILAGDALLNFAYETACLAFDSHTESSLIGQAMRVLAVKAGVYGMVGGQTADVEHSGQAMDEDTLYYIYKNKTSALIEASLMVGAILAGASDEDVASMETVGECVGIAFQIQDDILDVAGDEKKIGKPVNSDVQNEKPTYVAVHGLEKSRESVREYTERGIEALAEIAWQDARSADFLRELIASLAGRER